jgi:hypothetical protein
MFSLSTGIGAARGTERRLVPRARQHLEFLRTEYEARLRALRLDLSDGKAALELALASQQHAERLHKKGFATSEELRKQEALVGQAQRRLERCKVLLDLFLKIDQPPSPDEPAAPGSERTPDDSPASAASIPQRR